MQSGPFIKFIADLCRVEEKTVTVFARALKEAGLLTSGARGVNAPHMLPLDAARLIVALLATDRPSEAVGLVNRYMGLPVHQSLSTGDLPAAVFSDQPTLEQALVRCLALDPCTDKWMSHDFPFIEIVRNDKAANLRFGNPQAKAIFRTPGPTSLEDRRERGGIWRQHSIGTMLLASELWADRFNGVDNEGNPLDLRHPWNDSLRGEERQRRITEIEDYIRARDVDWMKGA